MFIPFLQSHVLAADVQASRSDWSSMRGGSTLKATHWVLQIQKHV